MAPRILLGLILSLAGFAARAGDAVYGQVSGGYAVLRGQAPALNFALGGEVSGPSEWLASVSVISGTARARAVALRGPTGTANVLETDNIATNFVLGLQYVIRLGGFRLGVGPSWMSTPAPYNGARVNFNLMAGYRLEGLPVTLWWDHYSCAGLCTPNEGRDLVLVGFRF